MGTKPIRTPEGIKFPVIKGELVTFLMSGSKMAQTTALMIQSLRYSSADKAVYITVETQGSIYQDAPVSVKALSHYPKDQVIAAGQTVSDPKGNPVMISEILQISAADGILNVVFKSPDDTYAIPFILA